MQTNLVLLGVALALAVPTTITLINEQGSFTEYDTVPRLFPGFTDENIQYIVITKAKAGETPPPPAADPAAPKPPAVEKLVLMRKDDGWVIGETQDFRSELAGVPVRLSQVQANLLDHIKDIRRDQQVLYKANASAEEMASKGLTPETGTLIECLNAESMATVQLWLGQSASFGKTGRDSVPGFYVARQGHNDIILYEPANRFWDVAVDPKTWIDTNVHSFEVDGVQSFSLGNQKGQVTFVRNRAAEGQPFSPWRAEPVLEGVGAVKQAEVERLLARFSHVACSRYLGDVRRPELAGMVPSEKSAEYSVSATLEDGSAYTMWVGKKIEGEAELYARFADAKGPSQFLVAIGDWVKSPFEVDPKTLFDPPAEAVAPVDDKQGAAKEGEGAVPPAKGNPDK